ncbi:MAG: hypothetical protein ACN2B6_09375 [Rickettsiales bacterium]
MKRVHISISTTDYEASLAEYTKRLGAAPDITVEGRYARWRTEHLNFTLSRKAGQEGGKIRHIGIEDSEQKGFDREYDVNGIEWEYFSKEDQDAEIKARFPEAKFNE